MLISVWTSLNSRWVSHTSTWGLQNISNLCPHPNFWSSSSNYSRVPHLSTWQLPPSSSSSTKSCGYSWLLSFSHAISLICQLFQKYPESYHFSSPSLTSFLCPGDFHFSPPVIIILLIGLPATTWIPSVLFQHSIINVFHVKSWLCSTTTQCLFRVKTTSFQLAYISLHHLFIHPPSLCPQLLPHSPHSFCSSHNGPLAVSGTFCILLLQGIRTCCLGCSSST